MENQGQFNGSNKSVVSMGDWMLTIFILAIPAVNFIMLFILAFGSSTPESKSNWAKAQLVWMAIGLAIVILMWGTIVAMVAGAAASS